MIHSLIPQNDVSLSHQLDVPFNSWNMTAIMFAVTTQIPLCYNLPLTKRKFFKLICANHSLFPSAEFTMADLFSTLLRLTATPCAYWSSFLAFTHNVCNVMRGRKLLLRHSVKHYETLGFKNTICVITSFF